MATIQTCTLWENGPKQVGGIHGESQESLDLSSNTPLWCVTDTWDTPFRWITGTSRTLLGWTWAVRVQIHWVSGTMDPDSGVHQEHWVLTQVFWNSRSLHRQCTGRQDTNPVGVLEFRLLNLVVYLHI